MKNSCKMLKIFIKKYLSKIYLDRNCPNNISKEKVLFCDFYQSLNFGLKFHQISMFHFYGNLNFWHNFQFLIPFSISDRNFNIWHDFQSLVQFSILDTIFNFWPKFNNWYIFLIFEGQKKENLEEKFRKKN